MYVSSLLLSKANKDWFQFDRVGAEFQRKQRTDFTALYSTYKSEWGKTRVLTSTFYPGEKLATEEEFSLGQTHLFTRTAKVLLPCQNQTSSSFFAKPLSASSVTKKKAVTRPFLEWRSSDCSVSSVLCYFLPLSLKKSCSFSHTGSHTELITSPSRACSFILKGRHNSAFEGA